MPETPYPDLGLDPRVLRPSMELNQVLRICEAVREEYGSDLRRFSQLMTGSAKNGEDLEDWFNLLPLAITLPNLPDEKIAETIAAAEAKLAKSVRGQEKIHSGIARLIRRSKPEMTQPEIDKERILKETINNLRTYLEARKKIPLAEDMVADHMAQVSLDQAFGQPSPDTSSPILGLSNKTLAIHMTPLLDSKERALSKEQQREEFMRRIVDAVKQKGIFDSSPLTPRSIIEETLRNNLSEVGLSVENLFDPSVDILASATEARRINAAMMLVGTPEDRSRSSERVQAWKNLLDIRQALEIGTSTP